MTNGTVNGRARLAIALTVVATLCAPAVADAQIRQVSTSSDGKQTINFTIGYFALKGLDSRVEDDVLLNELQSAQPLLFDIKQRRNRSRPASIHRESERSPQCTVRDGDLK